MASFSNEFGITTTPSKVTQFLEHIMKRNLELIAQGKPEERIVPCIWGASGIAKTSMVKQFEKRGITLKDKLVYPKVVHIALAQLEEAGDITTGLPITSVDAQGRPITAYAPPEWWPTLEMTENGARPVILLFDDFNRADPRILKAIMQILQDYRSNVHVLPDNCHIMLTGNPPTGDDGSEYMVNEIDKAILTRMVHITMTFDKIDWSIWAQSEGVDDRVISFVLTYPELVSGLGSHRTNPRSIVQLAKLIQGTSTDKENHELINMLASSCLDDGVVQTFLKFTLGDLQKLVSPEEILSDWKKAEKRLDALKKRATEGSDSKVRTDLIGIITDRMYVYLMQDGLVLEEKHYAAFLSFIKRTDIIPRDLMYALLRRLRRDCKTPSQNRLITELITHGGADVAKMIMEIV